MAAFFYTICLTLSCFFIVTAAYAAGTPLIFSSDNSDLRVRQISKFLYDSGSLITSPDMKTETALIDLNNDGIKEVIFRQTSPACEAASDCPHILAGISNKQPVMLAAFRARKIGISGEKSYGVYNILVYNQKQNDFQYITYIWSPFTSSFQAQ